MDNAAPSPQQTVALVGVVAHQPDDVVLHAMHFAEKLGAHLVCAMVDTTRTPIDNPRDAQAIEQRTPTTETLDVFDPDLMDHLIHLLSRTVVPWSLRRLAGEPVRELAKLADDLGAEMIVVGSRHSGLRAAAREFFGGSVAAQLAHRQRRPVLVVPLEPIDYGGRLPWEDARTA